MNGRRRDGSSRHVDDEKMIKLECWVGGAGAGSQAGAAAWLGEPACQILGESDEPGLARGPLGGPSRLRGRPIGRFGRRP